MEVSESPDSEHTTTISHENEIANHVDSSPTISNHGQTSSSGNDKAMAAQLRADDVDVQRPVSDAATNPGSSRQALPNLVANVANCPGVQQHQQLSNNDLNPQPPNNEHQQNFPFGQPPQVRPQLPPVFPGRQVAVNRGQIRHRIPHFHHMFGMKRWTFNDFCQRVPVRLRPRPPVAERQQLHIIEHPRQPPVRQRRRPWLNECHRLQMNDRNCISTSEPPEVRPYPPPLIIRREIEPSIFEEIYSYKKLQTDRLRFLGSNRCVCRDYVNFNRGNNDMITVIINTPNLTMRYSLTTTRNSRFSNLFKAYFGLTRETARTVFVACGRRLRNQDTPIDIGMKNHESIFTFVDNKKYVPRLKKKVSK